MITDPETNYLYLSDLLPKRYPVFFENLETILHKHNINFGLLPGTKDIWARDYMPVQVEKNKFVQFVYNPGYLKDKAGQITISDTDAICRHLGIETKKVNLKVDGGNIVKSKNKVIMCDRVFNENKELPAAKVIERLKEALEVEQIIFIPTAKGDIFGHADGWLRFYSEDQILVNACGEEKAVFKNQLYDALHNNNLNWRHLPYNPYNNKNYIDARGVYINYLHMKNLVLHPVFKMPEDEYASILLEHVINKCTIEKIDCTELAKEGGLLNCIAWNILK